MRLNSLRAGREFFKLQTLRARCHLENRCSIGRDGVGVALALRSPAALEDAIAGYRFLRSQRLEPKHIAVAGESAGGGLAIATLVSVRDAGLALPACTWWH